MPSLKYWDGAAWQTLVGGMPSAVPAGGAAGLVLAKKTAADYDTQWSPWNAPLTYGTTLPASPVDGQEHVLVDSTTNPTYQWRFRYNAASVNTSKWEFIGGAPFRSTVGTTEVTSAAGINNLATVGPSFFAPVPGDYYMWGTASVQCTTANQVAGWTLGRGDYLGSLTMCRTTLVVTSFPYELWMSPYLSFSWAAAEELRMKYWQGGASQMTWKARYLFVLPLRVGP